MIFRFRKHTPRVHPTAYIHPLASVTGNVRIGKEVFIGSGAAIRGDIGQVIIEDGCNVQENCILHTFPGQKVILRKGAHIGHGAIVHGAEIGKNVLVGMNAVVMDHVKVGDDSIIGALTLITEGTRVPSRSVVLGNPGKVVKKVPAEMMKWKKAGTAIYRQLTREYRNASKGDSKDYRKYKTWKRTR